MLRIGGRDRCSAHGRALANASGDPLYLWSAGVLMLYPRWLFVRCLLARKWSWWASRSDSVCPGPIHAAAAGICSVICLCHSLLLSTLPAIWCYSSRPSSCRPWVKEAQRGLVIGRSSLKVRTWHFFYLLVVVVQLRGARRRGEAVAFAKTIRSKDVCIGTGEFAFVATKRAARYTANTTSTSKPASLAAAPAHDRRTTAIPFNDEISPTRQQ